MTTAVLDLWATARAQAPDVDDHAARHQRGVVRLPYDLGYPGHHTGDLRPAWVCCDPACAGVELGEYVLDLNHGCCDPAGHVGLGRVNHPGYYHGPYTAHWLPS